MRYSWYKSHRTSVRWRKNLVWSWLRIEWNHEASKGMRYFNTKHLSVRNPNMKPLLHKGKAYRK